MATSATVSIIMPAYQAEGFIEETLDSILAQTYPHWELIVIDDHSTDGTAAIVKRYQANDNRIRYYLAPAHYGKASTLRNIAMQWVKGRFITFMDADDTYFPKGLEQLVMPLLEDSSLNAAMAFPLICDSRLRPLKFSPDLIETEDGSYRLSPDFQLSWEGFCRKEALLSLCCTMFPRHVMDTLGPLDNALMTGEDFKYMVSLFALGFDKVKIVPAYTFNYRNYQGSTTKSPERIIRHIDSYARISNWLFALPALPEHYRIYKGEHLAIWLACLLASLCEMNRKDLAFSALAQCCQLSDIPLQCKVRFFSKEFLRILVPNGIQNAFRTLLNKPRIDYFALPARS